MKPVVSIAVITFICNSCILPVPHRRVHAPGHEGQVLDEQTKQPVVGAKITSDPDETSSVMTNTEGKFRIKPVYGWHGAYLFGPISYSMFPHFDMPLRSTPFWIVADGYIDKKINHNGVIFLKPTIENPTRYNPSLH
ncbi:hypothetical protein NT6N_12850 [Oceaniferula spumae]|uniref:Carboxypeptidase regulatory-like domain-containing protein n=1 Tax=Oceaniferula spumae TaxID=2979115 RepID=A0AAT9FJS9_9BACT